MQILDNFFHLKKSKTSIKQEFIAALTTFVSLSYILFANPNILHDAGTKELLSQLLQLLLL